jgi:hypothetical protein
MSFAFSILCIDVGMSVRWFIPACETKVSWSTQVSFTKILMQAHGACKAAQRAVKPEPCPAHSMHIPAAGECVERELSPVDGSSAKEGIHELPANRKFASEGRHGMRHGRRLLLGWRLPLFCHGGSALDWLKARPYTASRLLQILEFLQYRF